MARLVINQRAALGILACALTALVYQPAFDLPFVFDDRTTVLLNPVLLEPWDLGPVLRGSFSRIAVNLSYVMDRGFWGFSSFGFHVTNSVLHIIVVGLVYGTCTRALADGVSRRRPTGASAGQEPAVEWPAFFAAAAFGLHPVMSATAFYVSVRSEMLCAAAFMIAVMFARRAIVASSTPSALIAAALGAVAFGSSAAGAALPAVLAAYDRWLLQTPGWPRRLRRAYLPALAAAVVGLAWRLTAWGPISLTHLPEFMLTESIVTWRYLALLLVPWGQAVVHEVRWVQSLADPLALLSVTGIVGTLAGVLWLRRIAPLVTVGMLWFFTAIATSMVAAIPDLMAEKQVYLAAAGLIMALFAAVSRPLMERRGARIAAAAVLAIFAVLTTMRSRVWNDPVALWTEAVTREPGSWQAHLEFAETLKGAGRCDRAVEEFAVARRLNSDLPPAPETGWAPCPPPRPDR